MLDLLGFFTTALTTLFLIVEPIGVVPTFATLTRDRSAHEIRRIALRASVFGAATLLAFAIGGRLLLDVLGIRVDAFRMAGGLVLLLTAFDMLRAKQAKCRCSPAELADAGEKEDIAIVPLAIPLLAGPGAMGAVMMLMANAAGPGAIAAVIAAIVITFLVTYLVLRSASLMNRVLGQSAMAALQRVLGLVLAATAIQFIVNGGVNLLRAANG